MPNHRCSCSISPISPSTTPVVASAAAVTTTQPSPAGVFAHSNNNNNTSSGDVNNNNNDMSPVSNSNSYSSVDTNQTLLNSLANQQRNHRQQQNHHQQQQHQQQQANRSQKYSQFMIITPAVSIDRDFEYESHLDFEDFANAAHNNGNLFRLGLRRSDSSSDDSGHSSDSSSFRSNYNPYLHHSRQHLLSKGGNGGGGGASRHFYAFTSSWRWCSLLCAAMRCFGAGGAGHGNAPYSSSLQHHRLRRCSSYNAENAYEHFAAPFKARKTRDHMNNITYEL
ncbi:GD18184 [Drosophila simulans]|uniref:GD18184 n=1 Tax=Drosophila simulans TaxID=7240 RepID=B4QVC7_DROSI|nr:GD18184 [Drosophila simulans]